MRRRLLATFGGVSGALGAWALVIMDWLAAPSHHSPYFAYSVLIFLFAVVPSVLLLRTNRMEQCRLVVVAMVCAAIGFAWGCSITMTMDQRLRWVLTDPSAFPPSSVAIGTIIGIIAGSWVRKGGVRKGGRNRFT